MPTYDILLFSATIYTSSGSITMFDGLAVGAIVAPRSLGVGLLGLPSHLKYQWLTHSQRLAYPHSPQSWNYLDSVTAPCAICGSASAFDAPLAPLSAIA